MENLEKIIDDQKRLLVLINKYEETTEKMFDCEDEEVSLYVAMRQSILDRMDVLTKEILRLCPEGTQEYSAFKNTADRSELSAQCQQIFDLKLEFNACLMRIKETEPGVIEHISIRRDMLKKKIQENNSGQTAKAAKYFNSGLSTGKNLYFPKNKRRI